MNIIRALFSRRSVPRKASQTEPRDYVEAPIFHAAQADSTEQLLADSRDYSGYVREAAIGRCVTLGRPELLPLIVERLNDWVPQVRFAARAGILTLLPFMPATELLAITARVIDMERKERDHYTDWLWQFETALVHHVGVEDFIAAAAGPHIKIARASVHVMLAHAVVELPRLIDLLLLRRDDIVLAEQTVDLIGQLPADERDPHYRRAAASHFGAVRAAALEVLLAAQHASPTQDELALAALTDAQSSVRYLAMQFMKTRGFDLRAHYRMLLADTRSTAKHMRICITALASLRHPDDIGFIQTFVHHDLILVRAAALAAWFKLDESAKDLIAATAIKDPARRVIKLGLELVRHRGAYIPFSAIQERLMEKLHVPLLMEFCRYDKWNHLECITRLGLACSVDEAVALRLDQQLLRWCELSRWGHSERTRQEQFGFLSSAPAVQAMQRLLPKDYDMRAYLRQELIKR